MVLTTRDDLVAATASGRKMQFSKSTTTTLANFYYTTWRTAGMPTGNVTLPTTTGQTLSRTSTGALPWVAPSGVTYCVGFGGQCTIAGTWLVADRLLEYGGLSGTTTTAQAVSALALPARASAQTDVELWVEIMTAAGATASPTVTASYTNQAGTSGRTATLIGGFPASGTPVNRCYPMTLQAGDTGVQSVQSFTSTTSTTAAGNIGLVLKRTLLQGIVPLANLGWQHGVWDNNLQDIPDDAALELYVLASGTASGLLQGYISLAQG